MARANLTDRFVSRLRSSKRVSYFDSKARGLALRVTPGDVKTWAFVYDPAASCDGSRWVRIRR
jgi:hypothetical protein